MTPIWSPILEGELAARAEAAIEAVREGIETAPLPAQNRVAGLDSGDAGLALFYEYLDRARPGAGYGEKAQQRLERAIDALGSSSQIPHFYAGFTGVSWVVQHLLDGPGEDDDEEGEADEEDPNTDIDAALLEHLSQTPWDLDYDLVSGLVGYGVYALERLPRPSGAACLELVVERLAEIAEPRSVGLAWPTPSRRIAEEHRHSYPMGVDELGVAHGIPGVIALLARVCTAGVAEERARALLAGAVPWLLEQKLPAGGISVFPYGVGPQVSVRPARTAWCYGDPGIAVALLLAARAMDEPEWEREALGLARAIARRPPENCSIDDAGLCHGAAGLGHLLNRLYQATGDSELLDAARAWFGRALAYREPGRGIGGFSTYAPIEDGDLVQPDWQDNAGLLTGSAGVALALLAATGSVEPAWDRALLLSPLPGKKSAPRRPE